MTAKKFPVWMTDVEFWALVDMGWLWTLTPEPLECRPECRTNRKPQRKKRKKPQA